MVPPAAGPDLRWIDCWTCQPICVAHGSHDNGKPPSVTGHQKSRRLRVHLRPISVVPILSRVVERLVHTYLYISIIQQPFIDSIKDQYAFRPTGSTTAALIDLLQQVTDRLQDNKYVVLISTDFSRAFDTVRHQILMEKMAALDLPDHIIYSIGWQIISINGVMSPDYMI